MSDAFLLRIGSAPRSPDSEEMLELVLAGASLEVDLAVLFEGPGVAHLREPEARRWRQLIDHDLAQLWMSVTENEPPDIDLPVHGLDAEGVNRLVAARTELVL